MGLSLHPYAVLRRTLVLALAAIALVPSLDAQQRGHTLITRAERGTKAEGYRLLSTARTVSMDVDMKTFREVASPNLMLAGVPIAPNLSVDLDLREFSVLDKDSKLTYTDDAGRHPVEKLSVRTYQGTVDGDPTSSVFLALADRSIVGTVYTEGMTYQISTDFSAEKRPGVLAAIAVPTSDLPDQKFQCGLKDKPFSKEELEAFHAAELQGADEECPVVLYAVRGVWDGDYEFYQEWVGPDEPGVEGALSYMVSLVAATSQIYERDAQVQITVAGMNIWTSPSDPYTEQAFMPIALDQARGFMATAYSGTARGFSQVFSSKKWSGIIGIANGFDLICDPTESITFQLVNRLDPVGGIAVIAHELGHLTGLRHTHSCTWAPHIDECAPAESGSCFAGTNLTEGTIMSYCKQKLMKIHPRQIPFLRNRVPGWANCMTDAKKLEIAKTLLHYPVVDMGSPLDSTWDSYFINRSRGDITVTRMVMQGDVYNQFEILGPETPFVVPSCDSLPLRIKFKAEKDTTHRGVLYIYHDGLNAHWGGEQHFRVDVEAFAKNDQPAFGFRAGGNQEVNFGTVKVDATVDTVFKSPKELFMNIGTAVLRVDSTAIVGPDRHEFELVEGSAPFVLEPGSKRPASIRFAPKTNGQKQAWLVVFSNSPGNEIDSLSLRGQVLPGPVLELRIANFVIDFGEVLAERTYDTTFNDFFYNNGTEPLEINAGITGDDAKLFPNTQWLDYLEPGEGLDLGFQFFAEDTVEHGWKTALIIIATNTPKGFDTVRVTAKVVGSAAVPGADPAETAAFMILPNPTKGEAKIYIAPAAGELGREYTLRITDASGRELRRETGRFSGSGIQSTVKRGELPAGIYFISVTTDKGVRSHAITVAP